MIKELLLAVILGAFLGFGATGGYFALTKNKSGPSIIKTAAVNPTPSVSDSSLAGTPVSSTEVSPTPGQSNPSAASSAIAIDSPKDQSIVGNSKVTIKGSTTSLSTIVIKTPVSSYTTSSDNNGNFSTDVEIESGANIIYISAFDSNDVENDTQLLVTYSTAKI